MFRNELANTIPSKVAVGEQEILSMLRALLQIDAPLKPLHKTVVEYIIRCANTELLSELAEHVCVDVRCAVASNQFLPDDLVWKLADDASFAVRARLAENKYLAAFLLETMAEDEDDRIAERALKALDRKNSEKFTERVVHWMYAALPTRQIG